MARVDLSGKKSGTIWMKRPEGRPRDRYRPTAHPSSWATSLCRSSLLLEVTNTVPGQTPDSGRRLLFSHTAFGQQGSWLVCSDQLGDLYLLDLSRNKSVLHMLSLSLYIYSMCSMWPEYDVCVLLQVQSSVQGGPGGHCPLLLPHQTLRGAGWAD